MFEFLKKDVQRIQRLGTQTEAFSWPLDPQHLTLSAATGATAVKVLDEFSDVLSEEFKDASTVMIAIRWDPDGTFSGEMMAS